MGFRDHLARGLTAVALFGGAGLAGAAAAQDAAAGAIVFKRCAVCHSTDGTAMIGPPLDNIVGRKAGTAPRYAYSKPMAGSGIVWTAANLDRFLSRPQAMIPGTVMAFPGLADAAERRKLIAFLSTLKK